MGDVILAIFLPFLRIRNEEEHDPYAIIFDYSLTQQIFVRHLPSLCQLLAKGTKDRFH